MNLSFWLGSDAYGYLRGIGLAFHLVPLLFRLQVFWKIAFMGKHFPCQFLNDKVSEHEGKVYPEILFPLSASFY